MQQQTESQARWYAIQTHPNREFLANSALAAVDDVDLEIVDGDIRFDGTASTMDVESVAGEVVVTGTVDELDVESRLGVAADGLDLERRVVRLADGRMATQGRYESGELLAVDRRGR